VEMDGSLAPGDLRDPLLKLDLPFVACDGPSMPAILLHFRRGDEIYISRRQRFANTCDPIRRTHL
jgi:hypothetical protein